MKSFPFVLSILLAVAWTVSADAQPTGGIDGGGGVRGTDQIRVRDALGLVAAGQATGSGAAVQSGLIPGLPAATPVALHRFFLNVGPAGVELAWEAAAEQRIFGFILERAEGIDPAPDSFTRIDEQFASPGPHRYLDTDVEAGRTYAYRFLAILGAGKMEILGPWTVQVLESPGFTPGILPVRPNPFKDAVIIGFALEETANLGWVLHDVRGRRVAGGGLSGLPPGYHAYTVRTRRPLPAGIYFLQIQAGPHRDVQKLVLLP